MKRLFAGICFCMIVPMSQISHAAEVGLVVVDAEYADVSVGERVKVTVSVYDEDGKKLNHPDVVWSVTDGIGRIVNGSWKNAQFEATAPGTGEVVATSGGISGSTHITVTSVSSSPPLITTAGIPDAQTGVFYSYQVQASDPDPGDVMTWSLAAAPSWLSIDSSSGMLAGTPGSDDAGSSITVSVRVTDSESLFDQTDFSITVMASNSPPSITTASLPDGAEGETYSAVLTANDPDAGDELEWELEDGPEWLSLDDDTGELSGIPDYGDEGSHTLTVRVTDAGGLYDSRGLTISVSNVNRAPSITTASLPEGAEGESYSAVLTASDPDGGDVLSWSLESGPSWLSLDRASGLLSGSPDYDDAGSHTLTVRVTDAGGLYDSRGLTVNVSGTNRAPTITTASLPDGTEGEAYSAVLIASDPDGDNVHWTMSQAPGWLSIDSATGLLSGIPSFDDSNDNIMILITVGDAGGGFSQKTFSLRINDVNRPPVITTESLPEAFEGKEYSCGLLAEDPDGDSLLWTLVSPNEWMSIDSSGVLSANPDYDSGGDYMIIVRVEDNRGLACEREYSLLVNNTNRLPVIVTADIPDAVVGTAYQVSFEAFDPDDDHPFKWTLSSGPHWLSLDASTGLLAGTPEEGDANESVAIVVEVLDSMGARSAATYSITVSRSLKPPIIMTESLSDAVAGESYIAGVSAEDPDGDGIFVWSVSGPSWLIIDPASGALSGTPQAADAGENIGVSVTATDGDGLSATLSCTISVTVRLKAPVMTTESLPDAMAGEPYTAGVSAKDPDGGGTFIWSVSGPSWLSIDSASGALSGTPQADDAGDNIGVSVTATDGDGLSATMSCTISVTVRRKAPVITTESLPDAVAGESYTAGVSAEDPDGDGLFVWSVSGPSWLSIDPASGALSGTPQADDAGENIGVSVTATNSNGLSVSAGYSITVKPFNNAPEFLTESLPNALEGEVYDVVLSAYDPDEGDQLKFELSGAPGWLSITPVGRFHGKPENIKGDSVVTFSVTVRDDKGAVSSKEFTIVVYDTEVSDEEPVADTVYELIIEEGETLVVYGIQYPLDFLNGMKLYFPPGSIDGTVELKICLPGCACIDNDSVVFKKGVVSAVSFEVYVDGERIDPFYFNTPVTIKIPYRKSAIDELGILPFELGLFYVDNDGGLNNEEITGIEVDESERLISGTVPHFSEFAVAFDENRQVAVEEQMVPDAVNLYQNTPNPFNPTTVVSWTSGRELPTTISIYDITGRSVKTLTDAIVVPGVHSVVWDATDDSGCSVGAGTYILTLTAGGVCQTRKMLLLK